MVAAAGCPAMAVSLMTGHSLTDVATSLRRDGLIDADADTVQQAIDALANVQPWYVRAMVGFGAWLASLLLIGFATSIGINVDGGLAVVGILFLACGIFLRRTSTGDFAVQFGLATSLAGQALFVFGIMQRFDWDVPELALGLIIVLNVMLFVLYPDRIHRVVSVLLCVGSLTVLFYIWKWNAAVPVLGPAVAAMLVVVTQRRAAMIANRLGAVVRPLQAGLMLGAFGCLMMSTVYVLPELGVRFDFYPRPWISTLLLGALLVYVAGASWSELFEGYSTASRFTVYGLLLVVIAAAWNVPGVILALLVMLLGAGTTHVTMIGAGIGFLAVFLAAYFWGIQLTMMQKSATLVATGLAIIVASWLVGRLFAEKRADV